MTIQVIYMFKPFSIGMISHTVNRTKVIPNAAKLFLEHQVKEARLELARARIDGRVDGLLTSAREHVISERRYGRRVDWLLGSIHFELFERFNVE